MKNQENNPHIGYVIETNGITIYPSGDCCIYEVLLTKLKNWKFDAVMLPINGRDATRYKVNTIGNMTYQEAVDLAGSAGARYAIPGHWDMFKRNGENPQLFSDYMNAKYSQTQPVILEHGIRFDISR